MSLAYSPSKPLPLSQVAAWDIDTDVAIVGFGIAGACAAIEARQAGAAVTVFEVAAAAGGNDDGSGIRMGLSVGGAAIHMEQFFATRPFYPPGDLVKGIFVNELGQRFINEDAYHGRVTRYMIRQPNDRSWLLVDNSLFGRPVIKPDITIAAAGDTWEEVETELGLPAGELVHTVDTYNRHAAQGLDPLWHKHADYLKPLVESPFAAISYCGRDFGGNAFTLGGLSTLPTGEVLTPEGKVIAGLYAAGRCACGIPRWGDGYSSGMSLGDASFFGRQAGLSAARRQV